MRLIHPAYFPDKSWSVKTSTVNRGLDQRVEDGNPLQQGHYFNRV